jgi:hypothetical protein
MGQKITKRGLLLSVILLVVVPLLFLLSCQGIIMLSTAEISKSRNPTVDLQMSDLAGTWKANYGSYGGVDKLILKEDGTFKQIYENQEEHYVFKTPWSKWWLERFADGRVRVYLKGARYYPDGTQGAERHAVEPWPFCDPFVKENKDWAKWDVSMVGKLVLNVRLLPSGELVLYHMWPGCGDGAFLDSEVFHRLKTPLAEETTIP